MVISLNLNILYPKVSLNITNISINSTKIKQNGLFIITNTNEKYLDNAIENGAICVVSKTVLTDKIDTILVKDPIAELAYISSAFYNHPSLKLKLNGVTGTDGKTTTASIFKHLVDDCGYIGTNGVSYHDVIINTSNTTPNSLELNEYLSLMVEDKIKHCSLEVSSHSIKENRVCNLLFDTLIFTNLSHEHLDYHLDMDEYYQTKKRIFRNLKKHGTAIINNDNFYGKKLQHELNCHKISFGIENKSDVMAKNIRKFNDHILFDLVYYDILFPDFNLPFSCLFNVYNALGAICAALENGIEINDIKERLRNIPTIPGRQINLTPMEPYNVIVDFAHTPNALFSLIDEHRQFTKKNIIVVFGCGGKKDKSKRPIMGSIATTMADFVIFTSDDPLDEDKQDIINQMITFVEKENYLIILDRKKAIEMAIKISNYGDTILITGKGEETFYEENNIRTSYSDIEEVQKNIKKYKNLDV